MLELIEINAEVTTNIFPSCIFVSLAVTTRDSPPLVSTFHVLITGRARARTFVYSEKRKEVKKRKETRQGDWKKISTNEQPVLDNEAAENSINETHRAHT